MEAFIIYGRLFATFSGHRIPIADSLIADLVRIQIRQSIITSLANAFGSIDCISFFGAAHTSDVIGNEVPIIAKRGETVFTPGQMRLLETELSGREPVKVEVNVHNNSAGVQARTEISSLPGGGSRFDIIIEQIEGQMTRNVA